MELGLAGRTAIVCGASSGMGLAIAEALAAEGANVAMFARRREILEREAERLGALGVQGDLTIPQHLERLVQATVGAFGGLDVLVLNGGGPPAGPASGLTAEAVEEAVALLLTAHVTLVARCLPHLRESGRGRIVAIESSSVREPLANLALSNAVRPGVVGWLKTLARELGPDGITVNTIAPGRIDTDRLRAVYGDDGPPAADLEQVPLRRLGTAAEIAAVVAFLASDRAGYVTGAVVPVDGGLTRGLLCEARHPAGSRSPARPSSRSWCSSRRRCRPTTTCTSRTAHIRSRPTSPWKERRIPEGLAASTTSTSRSARSAGSNASCRSCVPTGRHSCRQTWSPRRARASATGSRRLAWR